MSTTDFPKNYLDPLYWHPQCEGFEIIDWERFYATNPKVPSVFDPPQRRSYSGSTFVPLWWWGRSCYCFPISSLLNACCNPKSETEKISDGDVLFKKLLKPENVSQSAPYELRNHLIWTENNFVPETLINFSSWAWREQTEENRVIGVGSLMYDWTSDPTCYGFLLSSYSYKNLHVAAQRSPDGKWISISVFDDPSPAGKNCDYLYIYIVQEGDEFRTVDGEVMDYVKPGDLVRITWDTSNPYQTDNSKISYFYFPRKVATIKKDGELVKNSPHYEALLKVATNDASDKCCETCCYLCTCTMTAEERFDFQVNHIADRQYFKSSAAPPTSLDIDRALGEDDNFVGSPK